MFYAYGAREREDMTNKYVTTVRLLLTAWLLFVVWHHAHWSVAACLTLFAVSTELNEYLVKVLMGKVVEELSRKD